MESSHDRSQALSPSNTYYEWTIRRGFLIQASQAVVGSFIATFKDFPPRQRPQSFSIDQIMEQMQKPAGG